VPPNVMPAPGAAARGGRARVNHAIKRSPTILRVMENYVSLQFDRRLVEQLHRQRPSLPHEAPELSELFGLFEALVNQVWSAEVEDGDVSPSLPGPARPGTRE